MALDLQRYECFAEVLYVSVESRHLVLAHLRLGRPVIERPLCSGPFFASSDCRRCSDQCIRIAVCNGVKHGVIGGAVRFPEVGLLRPTSSFAVLRRSCEHFGKFKQLLPVQSFLPLVECYVRRLGPLTVFDVRLCCDVNAPFG